MCVSDPARNRQFARFWGEPPVSERRPPARTAEAALLVPPRPNRARHGRKSASLPSARARAAVAAYMATLALGRRAVAGATP
jgi:hypothetical protein